MQALCIWLNKNLTLITFRTNSLIIIIVVFHVLLFRLDRTCSDFNAQNIRTVFFLKKKWEGIYLFWQFIKRYRISEINFLNDSTKKNDSSVHSFILHQKFNKILLQFINLVTSLAHFISGWKKMWWFFNVEHQFEKVDMETDLGDHGSLWKIMNVEVVFFRKNKNEEVSTKLWTKTSNEIITRSSE